jgi:hypothetical protein
VTFPLPLFRVKTTSNSKVSILVSAQKQKNMHKGKQKKTSGRLQIKKSYQHVPRTSKLKPMLRHEAQGSAATRTFDICCFLSALCNSSVREQVHLKLKLYTSIYKEQ